MGNIALLTVFDNSNYGNRLQNYALTRLLGEYGDVCNIREIRNVADASQRRRREWGEFKLRVKDAAKRLLLPPDDLRRIMTERMVRAADFTNAHMPTPMTVDGSRGFVNHSGRSMNALVIGSDQVWNYNWLNDADFATLLGSFVPDGVPIISYAASIGVDELDDRAKAAFRLHLPRFHAISVREFRAQELIREATGLESTVVLDPTLMVPAEHWRTIADGFVEDDDHYVLTYFLGTPSEAQRATIDGYAADHGLRVRRILDLSDPETYAAGPQDFVELFSKADYVFTDSYHACCFSLLFGRQFTVFTRIQEGLKSMNSRMETLFRLFDLDAVVMDDGLAPQIDYAHVNELLEGHRASSKAWLDQAMKR